VKQADVIIAGGGVIGLMAGFALARRKVRVTVIDSGMPAATDASAGMLAPSFEHALHEGGAALAAFSRASLALWSQFAPMIEDASGETIDYNPSGILAAAFSEAEAHTLMAGGDGGEWLDARSAREAEPALSPDVLGAWFSPDDGQIDPRRLKTALKKAFMQSGGVFIGGGIVVGVDRKGHTVDGVTLGDGRRLLAPNVVIATGAHIVGASAEIANAIFPVKGEALALTRIDGSPQRVVRSAFAYLCPKAAGRIVIGATEVDRDWSLNTDDARVAALKAGAIRTAPGLAHAREIERWAGMRPATADGAPIIGPAPEGPDGLYYGVGHYRNGILLAPATAHALADCIIGDGLPPELVDFSPARFTKLGVS
jgi:glycine oxidase ThiO